MQSVASSSADAYAAAPSTETANPAPPKLAKVQEDYSSGLVNMEIEPEELESPTADPNGLYTPEDLESITMQLNEQSEVVLAETMIGMRSRLLVHGKPVQDQLADHGVLDLAMYLCRVSESSVVQEATCRAICSMVARNERSIDMLLCSPTRVIARMVFFIGKTALAPVPTPDSASVAVSAMWALSAACVYSKYLQDLLANIEPFVQNILTLMANPTEDVQIASVFLLRNMARNSPPLATVLLDAGCARPILNLLANGTLNSRGLACWAVHTMTVSASDVTKTVMVDMGVIPLLLALIRDGLEQPSSQAAAVWALGALAHNVPNIQNRMRAEGVFQVLVSLLESTNTQVKDQTLSTLYALLGNVNLENQSMASSLGVIPRLVAMLPVTQGSAKTVDKLLCCLLGLASKHTENQCIIASTPNSLTLLVRYLDCSSSRVQGLAAGLIRTLASTQSKLKTQLVAHGALSNLVDIMLSKDHFVQEQAIAAIFHLIYEQSSILSFLDCFSIQDKLFDVLKNSSKPSELAYTCSVMILYEMHKNNLAFGDTLRSNPEVLEALLRFIHPSCTSTRLRGHADRLVLTFVPDIHEDRVRQCSQATITAFRTFKVSPPAAGAQAIISCSICMDDQAIGPDGTPKDMVFLPCFHPFHAECISAWLQNDKHDCPCCKTVVVEAINSIVGRNLPASVQAGTA